MKLKNILIPAIATSMILGQVAPAFADSSDLMQRLSDLQDQEKDHLLKANAVQKYSEEKGYRMIVDRERMILFALAALTVGSATVASLSAGANIEYRIHRKNYNSEYQLSEDLSLLEAGKKAIEEMPNDEMKSVAIALQKRAAEDLQRAEIRLSSVEDIRVETNSKIEILELKSFTANIQNALNNRNIGILRLLISKRIESLENATLLRLTEIANVSPAVKNSTDLALDKSLRSYRDTTKFYEDSLASSKKVGTRAFGLSALAAALFVYGAHSNPAWLELQIGSTSNVTDTLSATLESEIYKVQLLDQQIESTKNEIFKEEEQSITYQYSESN